MVAKNNEEGLTSRYSVRKALGDYHPWKGFEVTDPLSGKDYLLFSLPPGSRAAICASDLSMRNSLFPGISRMTIKALSLQESEGGITFLLPKFEFAGIESACRAMKPDEAAACLGQIVSGILETLSGGLFFGNLSPGSLVVSGGRPVILPVAYLIPPEILGTEYHSGRKTLSDPLLDDLASLGGIVRLFCPHLSPETRSGCAAFAEGLASLDPRVSPGVYYPMMEGVRLLPGCENARIPDLVLLSRVDTPHVAAMNRLRAAAEKAREGGKQMVIVKGKGGEGKSTFIKSAMSRMSEEWGLSGGAIPGDKGVFQDLDSGEEGETAGFAALDDHFEDSILGGFVIDKLSRDLEHRNLVLVAVDEKSDPEFVDCLRAEGTANRFAIDEIELPAIEAARKAEMAAAKAGPGTLSCMGGRLDGSLTLMELSVIAKSCALAAAAGKGGDRAADMRVPEGLTAEERSVLDFIAVFRFEVPLSILQRIYSTEEKGFFSALQKLLAMGLVQARAETSSISGGKICLLFRINGRSMGERIRSAIPPARKKELHLNIAQFLRDVREAPAAYIYYHLARCNNGEEAAFKGLEIFHLLLSRKRVNPITRFHENFMGMKLGRHLPAETRFKLYLELGDYFSLIGNIGQAEHLYRKCREEMSRTDEWQTMRPIATEAIRRECEILEKKGDFKKAEALLKKALETHGEYIMAADRARLYNDLAWVHYRLGQLDDSWESCLLVHKIIDKKQNPAEFSKSWSLMGAIYWNRSKYDEAVMCHKNCLALREEINDETGVGAAYNNLGLVYRSMGRIKDTLDCFTKSMKIKQKENNIAGLSAAHLNLALAYMDLEEMENAEKNCDVALKLAGDLGNQQLLSEILGTAGEIRFLKGDFDRARDFYLRDLHICDKTKSMREKAITFRRLGELSLSEGKTGETGEMLAQARALNDRIGSRLETILLDLLEGRMLLAEGKRDGGRLKLEGTGFELSLLGRKRTAASVTAEIGELFLDEGNEHLAREYLLRSISLVGESDKMPAQVKQLQNHLDQRIPTQAVRINSDSNRFRALCRVVSFLRTIHDADKLYATVTETARNMMNMERAALILQTDGQDTFRFLASRGEFESEEILTDKNIIAILNITRQIGYPLDASRSQIPEGKVAEDFLKARPGIICAPLWIRDEVTGFLYLDSTRRSAEQGSEDQSFLVAFSQQVALGLERILLYDQLRETMKNRQGEPTLTAKSKERVTFHDIIGKSPAIRQVYELIENIRDMNTTVLLTGPNGSGKDLIARAIHDTGTRHNKPFHHLNCSALPRDLLESELFGHEKGSFTGAYKQKIGHFELACDGTIYLNEIGDMPLSLQPKLLRVLEEGRFFRVGGTKEVETNARVITATNRNLEQLVKDGTFREDLFYRINVFPIRIPALRERREDIGLLCNHFLTTSCRLYNIPTKRVSPEAMTYLNEYEWPGNVRELENTIKRLIIISKKDTILPEDLPAGIISHTEAVHAQALTTIEDIVELLLKNVEFSPGDPVLPKIEKSIVQKVVDMTGDKQKAAGLLGVSKPTLYAWLRKYEKKNG
ncbi:MAG: sigma 54-interacting transcriptional regulator [Candidatus Krumholzibacteria bacterium]|jgi:transcriptional regulator with GAF, ATPase, and Fis domain|nr:sigma 54-interacting transcriptional regulator [Candidatus Krumholzibacteria bacterium]